MRADHVLDPPVPKALHKAVRADQESVARLEADRSDVGLDELVACPEGLLQGVAARMAACLALVQLALAAQPADMGVVVGDLRQPPARGR